MIKKILFYFAAFFLFTITIAYATSRVDNIDEVLEIETKPNSPVGVQQPQQPPKQPQPAMQNKTQQSATSPNGSQPKKYKSIMFSQKNVDDIFKILPRFKLAKKTDIFSQEQDNISDFANNQEVGKQLLIDEVNISLYLNSIMYISKDFWSVWLNGNKITNLNNGDGEIVVTNISPLKASFVWTIGLSRWNIINSKGQIPESRYKINGDQVSLYFSLSPNQTYLPASDKIVEGRVAQKSPADDNVEKSGEVSNENRSNLYF